MTGKTVTREHLYDAVYGAAGLSRAEAAAIVELVLEEIVSCLERAKRSNSLPSGRSSFARNLNAWVATPRPGSLHPFRRAVVWFSSRPQS